MSCAIRPQKQKRQTRAFYEQPRAFTLLHDWIEGNFDHTSAADLHEKAWPIVHGELRLREARAVDEAGRMRGAGLATRDLDDVAAAAVQGRVRKLLLAKGRHVWGKLDRISGSVDRRTSQSDAHDDDVLDDIAQAVLSRGGEVLMLEPERLDGDAELEAVLRW